MPLLTKTLFARSVALATCIVFASMSAGVASAGSARSYLAPPSQLPAIEEILQDLLAEKNIPLQADVKAFIHTLAGSSESLAEIHKKRHALSIPTVSDLRLLRPLALSLANVRWRSTTPDREKEARRAYAIALILDKALGLRLEKTRVIVKEKARRKPLKDFRDDVRKLVRLAFGLHDGKKIGNLFAADAICFADLVSSPLFDFYVSRDPEAKTSAELQERLDRLQRFKRELGQENFDALVNKIGLVEVSRIQRAPVRRFLEIRKGPVVRRLPLALHSEKLAAALSRAGWEIRETARAVAYQGRIQSAVAVESPRTKGAAQGIWLLQVDPDNLAATALLAKKEGFTRQDALAILSGAQKLFAKFKEALGSEESPFTLKAGQGISMEDLKILWRQEQKDLKTLEEEIKKVEGDLKRILSPYADEDSLAGSVVDFVKMFLNRPLANAHAKIRELPAKLSFLDARAMRPEMANAQSLWIEISRPVGADALPKVDAHPIRFRNDLSSDRDLALSPAAHLLRRVLLETAPGRTHWQILLKSSTEATVSDLVYLPGFSAQAPPAAKVDLYVNLIPPEGEGIVRIEGTFVYPQGSAAETTKTEIAILMKLLEMAGFDPVKIELILQTVDEYQKDASGNLTHDGEGKRIVIGKTSHPIGVRLAATYDKVSGAVSVSDLAEKARIVLRASEMLGHTFFAPAVKEHVRVNTSLGLERLKEDAAVKKAAGDLLRGPLFEMQAVGIHALLPAVEAVEREDVPRLAVILNNVLRPLGLPLLLPNTDVGAGLHQDVLDRYVGPVETGVDSMRFLERPEGLIQNPVFASEPVRDFAQWLMRPEAWKGLREAARLLNRLIEPDPSGNPHTALVFETIGAIGGFHVLRTQVDMVDGGPVTFYGLRRPGTARFEMAYAVRGEEAYRIGRGKDQASHRHNRVDDVQELENRMRAFQIRMAGAEAVLPDPSDDWKKQIREILESRETASLDTLGVGVYSFRALPVSPGERVVTAPIAFNLPDETHEVDFEREPATHSVRIRDEIASVSLGEGGELVVEWQGGVVFHHLVSEREESVQIADRWLSVNRKKGKQFLLSVWSKNPADFRGKVMVSSHLAVEDVGRMHEAAAAVTTRGNVLGHAEIDARNVGLPMVVTGEKNVRLIHEGGAPPRLRLAINRYQWEEAVVSYRDKRLKVRFAKSRWSDFVELEEGDWVTVDSRRGLIHLLTGKKLDAPAGEEGVVSDEEKGKIQKALALIAGIQETENWMALQEMLKGLREPRVAQLILQEVVLGSSLSASWLRQILASLKQNEDEPVVKETAAYVGRLEGVLRNELVQALSRAPVRLGALGELQDLEGLVWIVQDVRDRLRVYRDVAEARGIPFAVQKELFKTFEESVGLAVERFAEKVKALNERARGQGQELTEEDMPNVERAVEAIRVLGLSQQRFSSLLWAQTDLQRMLEERFNKDREKDLFWLDDVRSWHSSLVGPKFANLAEMRRRMLPVPNAFVIRGCLPKLSLHRKGVQGASSDPWADLKSRLNQIFQEATKRGDLEEKIREQLRAEVRRQKAGLSDWIQGAPWPDELRGQLIDWYHTLIKFDKVKHDLSELLARQGVSSETIRQTEALGTVDALLDFWLKTPPPVSEEVLRQVRELLDQVPFVIIRSSSVMEDRKEMAAAGQFESKPGYRGEAKVLDQIKEVMLSMFNDRVIDNFREKDLEEYPKLEFGPAAIVQIQVDSVKSGILNTINNIARDWNQMVINAGFGQGEAVVQGGQNADRIVVTLDEKGALREIKAFFGKKLWKMVLDKDGSGLMRQEMEPEEQDAPVLKDHEIQGLVGLGLKIADVFASPQDIEWAIGPDGMIFITQSRPIAEIQLSEEPIPLQLLDLLPEGGEAEPDVSGGKATAASS